MHSNKHHLCQIQYIVNMMLEFSSNHGKGKAESDDRMPCAKQIQTPKASSQSIIKNLNSQINTALSVGFNAA